jgi:hypothetical protein
MDLERPDPGEGGGGELVCVEQGVSKVPEASPQLRLVHLGRPEVSTATLPQLTRVKAAVVRSRILQTWKAAGEKRKKKKRKKHRSGH